MPESMPEDAGAALQPAELDRRDPAEQKRTDEESLVGSSGCATAELHWRHQQSRCKYIMCGQHWRRRRDNGKNKKREDEVLF